MSSVLDQSQERPSKIGIIAGAGLYPLVLIKILKEKNCLIYCAGISDHVTPEIAAYCTEYRKIGIGHFGKAINFFKKHGVSTATMAGGINKKLIFSRGFIWKHFPDFYTLRIFAAHMLSNKKSQSNDSLLLRCVDAFELRGITIIPATDLAPELIMQEQILTTRHPTARELKDARYGWKIAREMSRLDIGQSVAVKNQSVIAIEALEGTNECIRRAGALCPSGEFSVVKIAKPGQDMRFDVPFFGMETIKALVEAGAKFFVTEAGKTIAIEQQEMVAYANRHNLCVAIFNDAEMQKPG